PAVLVRGVERPAPLVPVRPAEHAGSVPKLVAAVAAGGAEAEPRRLVDQAFVQGEAHRPGTMARCRRMIDVADEVQAALESNQPVVALESTIIAHGLPYPDNLEIARELEEAVRAGGAVPATVAVIEGVARIGLDPATLERLARSEEHTSE